MPSHNSPFFSKVTQSHRKSSSPLKSFSYIIFFHSQTKEFEAIMPLFLASVVVIACPNLPLTQ
jgi:hypothetical protein